MEMSHKVLFRFENFFITETRAAEAARAKRENAFCEFIMET